MLVYGKKEDLDKLSTVREVPGITKEKIFSKSLEFLSRKFNSPRDIIDFKDKEEGKIIGKTIIRTIYTAHAAYTFGIYVKDNKYKFFYGNPTDINSQTGVSLGYLSKIAFDKIEEHFKKTDEELFEFILRKSSEGKAADF